MGLMLWCAQYIMLESCVLSDFSSVNLCTTNPLKLIWKMIIEALAIDVWATKLQRESNFL